MVPFSNVTFSRNYLLQSFHHYFNLNQTTKALNNYLSAETHLTLAAFYSLIIFKEVGGGYCSWQVSNKQSNSHGLKKIFVLDKFNTLASKLSYLTS